MERDYITIANAKTAVECRCWIGIICMAVYAASPPGNRWEWLVSPFSTPATRWMVFRDEVKPFIPKKDADDLEILLHRLDAASIG